MLAVALLWIVIGLALWTHYKMTVTDLDDGAPAIGAPPQSTLVGALMWPFYLGGFLWNKASEFVKPRKK